MDKLQEMKDYMQQNQMKKVMFGGYNKQDVHMKFDMLQAMLDNYVKEQAEKEEAKLAELQRTIDALTAGNEKMIQNQYRLKEAYKTYCSEFVKRYSESLDALSGEFNKMLDNVTTMQKSISEESIVEGLEKALEMMEGKDV